MRVTGLLGEQEKEQQAGKNDEKEPPPTTGTHSRIMRGPRPPGGAMKI